MLTRINKKALPPTCCFQCLALFSLYPSSPAAKKTGEWAWHMLGFLLFRFLLFITPDGGFFGGFVGKVLGK